MNGCIQWVEKREEERHEEKRTKRNTQGRIERAVNEGGKVVNECLAKSRHRSFSLSSIHPSILPPSVLADSIHHIPSRRHGLIPPAPDPVHQSQLWSLHHGQRGADAGTDKGKRLFVPPPLYRLNPMLSSDHLFSSIFLLAGLHLVCWPPIGAWGTDPLVIASSISYPPVLSCLCPVGIVSTKHIPLLLFPVPIPIAPSFI